ncbi:phosphonate ABC transporter, permease protein PhnE [Pseudonocardia hydrocarbonoxydans]|uniref:ABC transporter permease n=1 Tax=Pseudonocardia hydrocarbonoxydans TaxID=76726 RepID=A0A4Y3WP24_9PSEU|nr:phosphonate ABC transporter, permease protein PhnE [Pseudonocardia hydrocarbonoxydans]GEC20637.1 ABC transporter permease [Pseudonocardia hydrocarbonoxydans]
MRPPRPSRRLRHAGWTLGTLLLLGAIVLVDARWGRLLEAPAALWDYGGLMADGVLRNPFDGEFPEYWAVSFELMVESLQMAWIGTVIGALLSFPLGFAAASNIAPPAVVLGVRQVLNLIRAVPELIFAIALMLPVFGLGPLAGALAIGVGSVGTLGKLTSEAIESIDPGPVEAARSTGARPVAVLRWGVVPQVLPEVVAFWLYRFEINIRASAVLGVLGAGGIGSLLAQLFERRLWDRIGITIVVIVVVTVLVDQLSAAIRHRIISGDSRAARQPAESVL